MIFIGPSAGVPSHVYPTKSREQSYSDQRFFLFMQLLRMKNVSTATSSLHFSKEHTQHDTIVRYQI